MRRAQRPIPADAQAILDFLPEGFVDDGCSSSPDAWFGFELAWACKIHDWRYCTRCHRPELMGQAHRHRADAELARNLRAALPWRWRWLGWVYLVAVYQRGGVEAWDSCGPEEGERCRHGMPPPAWMLAASRTWTAAAL